MGAQLTPIVSDILFERKIAAIMHEFMSAPMSLREEDGAENLTPEEQKAMDQLIGTFAQELKKAASQVKATAKDTEEVEDIKAEYPELEKLDDKVNEEVISGTLIAGIVAAIPSVLKIFSLMSTGISKLLGKVGFKKGAQKAEQFAEKLLHGSHELHKAYIGVIQQGLKAMIPDFSTLPADDQKKIAEVVYMIIVMYLGLSAGFDAANAFKHLDFVHGTVEGALAAIKAGELGPFLGGEIAAILGKA